MNAKELEILIESARIALEKYRSSFDLTYLDCAQDVLDLAAAQFPENGQ